MSGAEKPAGQGSGETPAAAGDPSMEDILASIRRILSEDEVAAGDHPDAPEADRRSDIGGRRCDGTGSRDDGPEPAPVDTARTAAAGRRTAGCRACPVVASTMVAPETAAAAASSVSEMVRRLAVERNMQVRSNGPTIEDIVREELRPLLKAWLDINLPPMVERLVRAEIERVVGRAVP